MVLANAQFLRSLNIAIRLSTLGSSAFNSAACIAYFEANPDYIDTFSASLFEARIHYALAGLDDQLFLGADGAVDEGNSKPVDLIEDIQERVDSDKDGEIPGTDNEKATIVCGYLATQE